MKSIWPRETGTMRFDGWENDNVVDGIFLYRWRVVFAVAIHLLSK